MRCAVYVVIFLSFYARAQNYTFGEAFPGITFTAPIEMLTPPDDSKRIFIVQQNGITKVFHNKPGVAAGDVKNFMNVSSKIIYGGERGLLGMAFHPEYETNGYFYLNYTRTGPLTSVISRFSVKPDNPEEADPDSELILFTQAQPYDNHNGGKLAFGNDGYLYISLGDGGSGGDPQNNAQNLTSLLGKILRIDVDQAEGELNYRIPATNPFKDNTDGYREEIYAYGLRNVWKFSIDPVTGQLWAADVGQGSREEIDLIVNGGNYGWRLMEGTLCYNPATNCNNGTLILPIFEYPHTNNNNSITGGHVYRGIQIPEWQGHYLYGDYVSGRIWKLAYENNVATNEFLLQSGGLISSFGEDHHREPYALQYSTGTTGKILRFFPVAPSAPSGITLTNLSGSNTLEWVDQSGNELGFIIERSPESESNFEVLDTVMYNTESYVDDLGSDVTVYTYRVKAYNDGGESDYAYTEDIILSVWEVFFNQVRIYPNPATEDLNIDLPAYPGESQIRMFNLTQQEISAARIADQSVRMDVSNLPPGIYLLEIKNRLGSVVRKINIR
jgi:glucose/arabinose dehydrogenase